MSGDQTGSKFPSVKLGNLLRLHSNQPAVTNFKTHNENGYSGFTFIFDNTPTGINHKTHFNTTLSLAFARLKMLIEHPSVDALGQFGHPKPTESGFAYTNLALVTHYFTAIKIEESPEDSGRGIITLQGIFTKNENTDDAINGLTNGYYRFGWRGRTRFDVTEVETFDIVRGK